MLVGDDGGYNDYIMNYCSEKKLNATLHNICESNNKCNEIKSVTQSNKNYNPENFQISFDDCLLEQCLHSSQSFKKFFATVKEKFSENRINLFISYCKYDLYNFNSNEVEYKKKMLLNLLLCLNILDSEGTFIIKLPESNSTFTLSVIYILYKFFSKVSLFKPFTSHNITSTRYFACIGFKYFTSTEEFSDKIEELLVNILDCSECIDSLFETNFLKADNRFRNYIFEINKDIEEKRINRFNEMLAETNNNNRVDYHKLNLKKELYSLWKLDLPECDRVKLEEFETGNHKKKPHTFNDVTKTGKIKSLTVEYNESDLDGLFTLMEKNKIKKPVENKIVKQSNPTSTPTPKKPNEKKENVVIKSKKEEVNKKAMEERHQVENTKVKLDQSQINELLQFKVKK